MRIGELSRRTGVSIRMVRYYEARGLLSPARTTSGYRVFEEADVEAVTRIATLNAAGLTLDVIRRILPCARPGTLAFQACDVVKDNIRRKLDDLDARIVALTDSRRLLTDFLNAAD